MYIVFVIDYKHHLMNEMCLIVTEDVYTSNFSCNMDVLLQLWLNFSILSMISEWLID